MIDLDSCYLPLGRSAANPQARYRLFVEKGAPSLKQKCLSEAWQRNQLSGNTCFVSGLSVRSKKMRPLFCNHLANSQISGRDVVVFAGLTRIIGGSVLSLASISAKIRAVFPREKAAKAVQGNGVECRNYACN